MANSTKPEVSAEELKNAQDLWQKFTLWSKWGTIIICASLVLLALILI